MGQPPGRPDEDVLAQRGSRRVLTVLSYIALTCSLVWTLILVVVSIDIALRASGYVGEEWSFAMGIYSRVVFWTGASWAPTIVLLILRRRLS